MTKTKKFLRRYSNLPSLIHLLTTQSLTFLDPESWDDKNDSFFMRLYKEKQGLDTLLAVCFSQVTETYHHWSVFASGSSGVCISFRKQELLAALKQHKGVRNRPVSYVLLNKLEETPCKVADLPFMKRAPFEPESEFRVIFEENGTPKSHMGIAIPLSCIDRISLSPWMPSAVADAVKDALKQIDGAEEIEITRSTLIQSDRWAKFGRSVIAEPENDAHRRGTQKKSLGSSKKRKR